MNSTDAVSKGSLTMWSTCLEDNCVFKRHGTHRVTRCDVSLTPVCLHASGDDGSAKRLLRSNGAIQVTPPHVGATIHTSRVVVGNSVERE